MTELNGRVAIVTGATKGIGRAIAEALVGAGVRVTIGARTKAEVERVARELDVAESSGKDGAERGRTLGVACDVRSHEACRRLVEQTISEFGRLDILVNNAGIGAYADVAEMDVGTWDAIIQTNLSSLFYCCHEAIPRLRESGGGWIINIGSLQGRYASAGGAAYNASKFGLIGFTEALMQDVRHDGIRVTCIMPGSVATEFGGHSPGDADAWKIQPEDIAEIVTDLLAFPERTLPSRIEVRPSRPPRR